jgi:hypothetical protein
MRGMKRTREAGEAGEAGEADEAGASSDGAKSQERVFVRCTDAPDALFEVHTPLLESYDTRIGKSISYDEPSRDDQGRKYWHSHMTSAMWLTFQRSLLHARLSLAKGVSLEEALNTFEYEGVPIGLQCGGELLDATVKPAHPGVAFTKSNDTVHKLINRTCEQVATSIVMWPRLEYALNEALLESSRGSCTPTRAWLKLCKKPTIPHTGSSQWRVLAKRWPVWLASTMYLIGSVHDELVKRNELTGDERTERAFDKLTTLTESRFRQNAFMTTVYDKRPHSRRTRAQHERVELFCREIRSVVSDDAPNQCDAFQFARACIALSEQLLFESPSLVSIFNDACVDDNGGSHERSVLYKALKERNTTLIRWDHDVQGALAFPPSWKETAPQSSLCMLLHFDR